jgi:MYXO-CTERM domain-containing protein
MKKINLLVCAGGLIAATSGLASAGGILWDNGPMVTHPGAGSGGADVSMASVDPNAAGSNVRNIAPGQNFRIADDFNVGAGGWTVNSVVAFGYETGATGAPTWSGANMNIWDGAPNAGGTIVATSTAFTLESTGIFRVFNGAANLGNTARAIWGISFDFGSLDLAAGNYWMDWQVEGGASGWANYVMDVNPDDVNNPITRTGNALQMFNADGDWQFPGGPLEVPFLVRGIPAPGAVSLIGLAGLAAVRRRRA